MDSNSLCQCCRLLISPRLISLQRAGKRRARPHRDHSQTSLCMSCISGTSLPQTAQSLSTCGASTLHSAWYAVLCCCESASAGTKAFGRSTNRFASRASCRSATVCLTSLLDNLPMPLRQIYDGWETNPMSEETLNCRMRQQEFSI